MTSPRIVTCRGDKARGRKWTRSERSKERFACETESFAFIYCLCGRDIAVRHGRRVKRCEVCVKKGARHSGRPDVLCESSPSCWRTDTINRSNQCCMKAGRKTVPEVPLFLSATQYSNVSQPVVSLYTDNCSSFICSCCFSVRKLAFAFISNYNHLLSSLSHNAFLLPCLCALKDTPNPADYSTGNITYCCAACWACYLSMQVTKRQILLLCLYSRFSYLWNTNQNLEIKLY